MLTQVTKKVSYKVWIGGYIDGEFVLKTDTLTINDSFLGLDDRQQLDEWLNQNYPGMAILDSAISK